MASATCFGVQSGVFHSSIFSRTHGTAKYADAASTVPIPRHVSSFRVAIFAPLYRRARSFCTNPTRKQRTRGIPPLRVGLVHLLVGWYSGLTHAQLAAVATRPIRL